MTCAYFIFAVFAPLLHVFLIFIAWMTARGSSRWKARLNHWMGVVYAFAALDVYVLSIFACLLQLGFVTSSIAKKEICDDPLFDTILGWDVFPDECFRSEGELINGFYVLLGAIVWWWTLAAYTGEALFENNTNEKNGA